MNRQRHALLYPVAGALFLAGTLQAGLVTSVNGSGNFYDLSEHFDCSNTGTASASCSVYEALDAFHFMSGSYQANAQYGSVDVTSMSDVYDLSGSGFNRGGDLSGSSSASFADTLLLTGGIGFGTLVFVTEYRGTEMDDYGCQICANNATATLNTFTVHPQIGSPTITNLSFSFTFDTLFNLNASASAYSSALGHESAMTNAHLKIDAIEVLDSNGALITSYAVTSGSGANYPFVTPEPGTFALGIAALIALLVIRRKSISACC